MISLRDLCDFIFRTSDDILQMIFNSFNFLVIFPLLFLLYYAIPAKAQPVRNLYLLVVSYLLYLNFKPAYALILLGVTAITFFFAKAVSSCRKDKRKLLLVCGVLLTLLPLVTFKYYNFINESCLGFLESVGIRFELPGLNWAIPVGISFYTFQALSYLWDVYYGRIESENNFLDYALYVSFFPSIVSGPINKASLVLPQIKALRPYFDYGKAVEGLKQMLWGMFMKVVVADRIALYVDTVFSRYENYSGLSCLAASLLYSVQIYADFAGYSLMAIGVGKLLGFELAENFRRPYFSFSVTDFWRRWHISLSTWLKDYVYIPLGGSRCSKARNYWNIVMTFLVSGIWHGANWTYLVWGGLHGVIQAVENHLPWRKRITQFPARILGILGTFAVFVFTFTIFRADSLTDAVTYFRYLLTTPGMDVFSKYWELGLSSRLDLLLLLAGVALLILVDVLHECGIHLRDRIAACPLPVRWCIYECAIFAFLLMGKFFSDGGFLYARY